MNQKTIIFLQARMGSTRLPEKVMMEIEKKPIVELIHERLSNIKNIDKIILITRENKRDEKIVEFGKKKKWDVFQGNEENLLDRFFCASKKFPSDNIIRVNADCPLVDFNLINQGLEIFSNNDYDMLSTDRIRTFPHGFDFEIFKTSALQESWREMKEKYEEDEFYNSFISPVKNLLDNSKFKNFDFVGKEELSHIRLTLDFIEDYNLIKKIYEKFYKENPKFSMNDILEFLDSNPELLRINEKHIQFKKKS